MNRDPRAPRLSADTKCRLLLEISHQIRGTLDLHEILDHLLEILRTVVAYDAAGIFVLRSELVRAHGALPEQMIAGVARRGFDELPAGRDPMLLRGEGITGHVIRSGEVVVLPDVRLDPRYVVGRAATRSEVTVPILLAGRPCGALNLESDQVDAFGARDLEALRFFAEAAAIAIEKAVLHERLLEGQRTETQLRIAQEVQARLLPATPPELPGFEIEGLCIPTFRIGGDAYDYIPLADGRLAIVVADVAGKGIPAALVLSAFRALLRTHAQAGLGPVGIAQAVNRQLPESLAGLAFVTAWIGLLDPVDGRLESVNCGHNPPLLARAAGAHEWLEHGGPLLGVFGDARYESAVTSLQPGDTVVLYTDGVTESADHARRDFGAERLATVVSRLHGLPPRRMIHEIVRLTREFSGAVEFEDDFTLVVVRRTAS